MYLSVIASCLNNILDKNTKSSHVYLCFSCCFYTVNCCLTSKAIWYRRKIITCFSSERLGYWSCGVPFLYKLCVSNIWLRSYKTNQSVERSVLSLHDFESSLISGSYPLSSFCVINGHVLH